SSTSLPCTGISPRLLGQYTCVSCWTKNVQVVCPASISGHPASYSTRRGPRSDNKLWQTFSVEEVRKGNSPRAHALHFPVHALRRYNRISQQPPPTVTPSFHSKVISPSTKSR